NRSQPELWQGVGVYPNDCSRAQLPSTHVVAGSGESRAPRGSLVSPAAHGCPAIHRLCCAVGRACFFLTPPPITSPVDMFYTVSRQKLQAALPPSSSH